MTGASGFLGTAMVRQVPSHWSQGITPRATSPQRAIDLTDEAALVDYLDRLQPDAILHLAAQANSNRCQEDPAASARINIWVPHRLAQYCADRQIPLVFTSTDQVFDGKEPPYNEAAPVNPLNHYGDQKAQAEAQVLATWPRAIVARLPLLFGLGTGETGELPRNFMQGLQTQLRSGQSVTLFADEWRTPVSRETAAAGLWAVLDWAMAAQHQGLLHLGGPERVSRYDLGRILARSQGWDEGLVRANSLADSPLAALRAIDVSLDSQRAYSLGYVVPDLLTQCRLELTSLG